MCTVYSVERNAAGEVVSYTLFHGRNSSKGSGLNTLHRIYPGNSDTLPPFGNWTEPVVGIAPMLPVVKGPAAALPIGVP